MLGRMWYYVFIDKRSFRIFIKYLIIWCITFNREIYGNYINKTGCPLSIINNWNQIKIRWRVSTGVYHIFCSGVLFSYNCVIWFKKKGRGERKRTNYGVDNKKSNIWLKVKHQKLHVPFSLKITDNYFPSMEKLNICPY